MVDNGSGVNMLAGMFTLLPFETISAKEARNRSALSGKTPRLLCQEVYWGLQCGLSGNQAPLSATKWLKI